MPSTSAQQAFDQTVGGQRDPWTRLAALRRDLGVVEGDAVPDAGAGNDDGGRRFAVLRYDDCARVLRDNVTFSSRVYERVMGPVMGHTILEMDEPEHGRFRRLAGHAFRQKALQRWESEPIEPLAPETIGRFARRGHGALVPRAIEELLRWEPAIPFIPRLATRDVTIADVAIPAGARVTLCLGSANRDETRFAEPDRFDIHRPEQPQLAFASGPHMCLGMHLARTEMRVVLDAVLDRLPDVELAPGPEGSDTADPPKHGLGFRKPTCLPVRFTPCS